MTASLFSNPKRVMQMLWAAAALMLTAAVIHSLSDGQPNEWVFNKLPALGGRPGSEQSPPVNKVEASPVRIGSTTASDTSDLRLSMERHMRLAEASWAKTVKQRHEMIKADYGDIKEMPLFPAVDGGEYHKHPYTIWDFTPASYGCPHEMERVGRMGDGGKWVCGMSRYEEVARKQPCVIYSFGVRDESSFENEMLSRTQCDVFAYDFSVVDFGEQLEPENRHRAHFMQAGIGKTDTAADPPFYSIVDLMKMNGHQYIDILKMDIEFAEFESMEGLDEAFPAAEGYELPIGQLMIEIHFFNGMTAEGYLAWWEKLEARGLRPTWTEPNLLAVTMNLAGDKAPLLAEYTLINVKDKRNVLYIGP